MHIVIREANIRWKRWMGDESLGVAEASQTKVTSRSTHQFPSNPPRYLAKVPTSCVAGIRPAQAVDGFPMGRFVPTLRFHGKLELPCGFGWRLWKQLHVKSNINNLGRDKGEPILVFRTCGRIALLL